MPFSDVVNQAALDHIFKQTQWALPSTLEVGLSTTAPAQDGTGITEPTANGYARVAVAAAGWTRTVSSINNTSDINFPAATGSWGTVTHFVVWDDTSGDMIGYGALTASQEITSGMEPYFPAEDLTIAYT